ncbi:MAG: response regulator [Proteobacteria bacterium]|nr:MAG: response regulator [Pseudomonadota bacterium]
MEPTVGSNFRDRKNKVIAVDPNGATRTLISELLREKGFTDVQAVPSLKEAVVMLETEPVSWLLTSVFVDQEINLFQLLNMISHTPDLQSLRVSAFIEESEAFYLPAAFELGLLSFHLKPFTKDKLKSEFDNFFGDFEALSWKSLALSAAYLRRSLSEGGNYGELLHFERQMMQGQPGNLQQLLNLSIPLIKLNKIDEATSILTQVQKLDPSFDKQVKQIFATHLANVDASTVNSSLNILNLKSAVIVESDSAIQKDLSTALKEMGVEKVEVFSDGRTALEFLKANGDNDLIIQEWKIPQITGPLFLQKAKDEGGQTAPFILYTSLIDQNDSQFLKEMGVACVMTKPTSRTDIIKNIIWTVQQERSPTEKKALERKFRQALDQKNLAEAKAIMGTYVQGQVSAGAKLLMEAELCYYEGDYERARELAFGSLKNSGDSIFVLNLLGKIMMQLRDVVTALKCFEKAQELAPQNLSRLCQIAEIQADLGQDEKSEASLAAVSDVDPDSEQLKETRVKIAINSGTDDAKQLMGQLKDAENVVSYMNNLAVAMARCGKVEDGINQYKKTMNSIPDERKDLISTVQFNLALAHLRAGEFAPAKEILTQLVVVESKVQAKSKNILKKINHSETAGTPLQFKKEASVAAAEAAQTASAASETGSAGPMTEQEAKFSRNQAVATAMLSRPGDRCCFMMYQSSAHPAEVTKMLETHLRYAKRAVIKKDIAS